MGLSKPKNITVAGGGMEMELLWENASLTSSFAPQTVSINFEECDLFLIVAVHAVDAPITCFSNIIKPGDKGSIRTFAKGVQHFRDFDSTNTGITFANTFKPNSSDSINNYTIPYKVYGIKGVKTV